MAFQNHFLSNKQLGGKGVGLLTSAQVKADCQLAKLWTSPLFGQTWNLKLDLELPSYTCAFDMSCYCYCSFFNLRLELETSNLVHIFKGSIKTFFEKKIWSNLNFGLELKVKPYLYKGLFNFVHIYNKPHCRYCYQSGVKVQVKPTKNSKNVLIDPFKVCTNFQVFNTCMS